MVDPDQAGPTSAQADQLIVTVSNLTKRIQHTRRLARVLAVSVLLDVLLSVGLAFAFARSNDASRDAQRAAAANKETIRTTCLAANDARTRNVALWDKLLSFSPATTAEAQARADQIRATVNETFVQRDCGP